MSQGKDPNKVKAGQIGSRRRWGEQRVLRLDELNPVVRQAVNALIAADQAVKAQSKTAPVSVTTEAASAQEVRRASDEHPAA